MDAMEGWIECRSWKALPWADRLAILTVGSIMFAEGQRHLGTADACAAFGHMPMTFSVAHEAAQQVLSTRPPPSPNMSPDERVTLIGELLIASLQEYAALSASRASELGGFH